MTEISISPALTRPAVATTLSKVPEVTATFWLVKILTTGMGETTSDFFGKYPVLFVPALLVAIYGVRKQFRADRYVPWIYWLCVVMVSVFGTVAADGVHVGLHIPYEFSTAVCAAILVGIFVAWYRSEGTLSIHSITTRRRETFYWSTVLATFALGTAAGDLTASRLHLGYFSSGLYFGIAILVPAVAHWKFRLPAIPAFWLSYILTRPLGASFADWMGVEKHRGGLGWGTGPVSLVAAVLIVIGVGWLTLRDERPQEG